MWQVAIIFSCLMMMGVNAITRGQHSYPVNLDKDIQAKLTPDEVILCYGLADSVLSLTAADHQSEVKATIVVNDLFWESLNAYRKKIKSADLNNFFVYSELLYSFLVQPVRDILRDKQRLIIIPDQALEEVPFEALTPGSISDKNDNSKTPRFLIHDFEVVYRRAEVSRWVNQPNHFDVSTEKKNQDFYAFIGFSPGFTNHSSKWGLPATKTELASIESMFETNGLPARLVEGESSRKDNFKEMAGHGRILHLATHYFNGSDEPNHNGFLFSGNNKNGGQKSECEEVLTIEELCDLRLQADLVVLSACASGMERVRPGKYRNAIPEIFLTAGAQNILSTLWNVTDRLTGSFMVNFYRLLFAGKSYSAALREVKLQMISCRETSLPTVWAAYILTER